MIHDTKVRRLGVELTAWPFTALMYSRLLAAISGVNVDDCSDLVAMVRVVKSLEEIAYLEQAARISGVGVLAGIRAVREGATDQDVAASVYSAMILAGGEYPSLPALIAAGSATALFHNTWSGRSIGKGDVVFLEVPTVFPQPRLTRLGAEILERIG